MAVLLVLVFIVVPLAELAVVVAAAESFGLGVTLLALLAFSVAGAWLVKREGMAVWRRANQQLASGRPPAVELLDGAMILAGGALLLTPGFITDSMGFLLLLPPVRAALRPLAVRAMTRRANVTLTGSGPGPARESHHASHRGFTTVIIDGGPSGAGARHDDGVPPGGRREPSAKVLRVEPNPSSRARPAPGDGRTDSDAGD